MTTADHTAIETDLAETLARMDRTRDAYTAKLLRGDITRAQTTTYNARMGQLAERRDALRALLAGDKS